MDGTRGNVLRLGTGFLLVLLCLLLNMSGIAQPIVTLPIRTLGECQRWRIDQAGNANGWFNYYKAYKLSIGYFAKGADAGPFDSIQVYPYTNAMNWVEARTLQEQRFETDAFAEQYYNLVIQYPGKLCFQIFIDGPPHIVDQDKLRFTYQDSLGSRIQVDPEGYYPTYDKGFDSPTGAEINICVCLPERPERLEWFSLHVWCEGRLSRADAKWSFLSVKEDTITFADPALEELIRQKIELPHGPIEYDDVCWIRELSGRFKGIVSLLGIEYLTKLESLDLSHNEIADLSPLAGLEQLKSLVLVSNKISSVAALARLAHLEKLHLGYNHISSLDGLQNLATLRTLYLPGNPINSLRPLSCLPALELLWVTDALVTDLSPLAGLHTLRDLSLANNQIDNLEPLRNLVDLQSLNISNNAIDDLAPLTRLTRITELDISSNNIKDITPLEHLVSLERVDAEYNCITNINSIAELPHLSYAYFLGNQISTVGSWIVADDAVKVYVLGNPIRMLDLPNDTWDRLYGVLREEEQRGDYTVRVYNNDDLWTDFLEIWRGDELIYVRSGHRLHLSAFWYSPILDAGVTDITGNGYADVLVWEHTGGIRVHVFELEPEFRLAGTVYGDHSEPWFTDLNGDGFAEVLINDWTFAYWKASFAESPAPTVVLKYDVESFRALQEYMRVEPPLPSAVAAIVEQVYYDEKWNLFADDRRWFDPPAILWEFMLDLIYGGNWDLAFEFLDKAWPENVPGKDIFSREFVEQLQRSPYWDDIAAGLYGDKPGIN
ncbi:MAG: leucine-rich repeat domain-containing protein [Limnochordia bacterium]|nr:leucine-rich repeat domain-containing protein [Limnochordia bacterium]